MKLLDSKKLYRFIKKIARLRLKVFTILLVLIVVLETTGLAPSIASAAIAKKKETKVDKIIENLFDNFIECMHPTICFFLWIPKINICITVWGWRQPALLIETVNKPGMSLITGDLAGDLKLKGIPLLSGGVTTPDIGNLRYNEVHIFSLDYSPVKVCAESSQGMDMSEMSDKIDEILAEKEEGKTGAHVVIARPQWNRFRNPLGDYCMSDRLQLVYPKSSGPFKPGARTREWAPKAMTEESTGGDMAYVYWRAGACVDIRFSCFKVKGGGQDKGQGGQGGGQGGQGGGMGGQSGEASGDKGKGEKISTWTRVAQYMLTALTVVANQWGGEDQQTAATAAGTAYSGYKVYKGVKGLDFFGGTGAKADATKGGKDGEGDATKGGKAGGGSDESGGKISESLTKYTTVPYVCQGDINFCIKGQVKDYILKPYYFTELDCIEWRFSFVERIMRLFQKVPGLSKWLEKDKKEEKTEAEKGEEKGKDEGEKESGWIRGALDRIGCEFYLKEEISKGGKCIGQWGPLNPRRGHYIHHNPYISSALTMWRAIDIMFTEKEKEETENGAGVEESK